MNKTILFVLGQLLLFNLIYANDNQPIIAENIKSLTSLTIWAPTNYQTPFKLVCEGTNESPWFAVYWLIDGQISEQYTQITEKYTNIKKRDNYYMLKSTLTILNWDMYKDYNLTCVMADAKEGILKRSTKLSLLEECMSVNNH
ncbi:IL-18 binding protein [Eptesipox virus]|uniref:IL-18 binding protein n=1 Tax=Eptesipox virus TaxID=1329402 RepID=A0A220T6N8_9POXV|nr:IL-18 binding protein [Eptesipox virus]ASK51376.1 IL-18 binding protein [Eptesipox virus]WAH71134.1 IL-18 binding protein [Eptesipox virus]